MYQTDTGDKTSIIINNKKADLYYENDEYSLIWDDGIYVYYLHSNCSKEDIINIAKSTMS